MHHIPLVRARYIRPFASVLDSLGAPLQRLIERAGLSGRVLENGEDILPARQVWAFIGSTAETEGIHDYGLQAGRVSIEAYGEFSRRLFQAPNLIQGLETFCRLARCEYSHADFYTAREDGQVWFRRGPIDGNATESKHVELLVVAMMIATVRIVAGPGWLPEELHLQTKDPRGIDAHENLSSSRIRFGCRVTGFAVPVSLLPVRLTRGQRLSASRDYERLGYEMVPALRQLIDSWPADSELSVGTVAEDVGMSLRTFQRRLTEAGTSFSALVTDVRMNRAVSMLRDCSIKLGDIAWQLGYADQANFTRAFRRWASVSPQEYRRDFAADTAAG